MNTKLIKLAETKLATMSRRDSGLPDGSVLGGNRPSRPFSGNAPNSSPLQGMPNAGATPPRPASAPVRPATPANTAPAPRATNLATRPNSPTAGANTGAGVRSNQGTTTSGNNFGQDIARMFMPASGSPHDMGQWFGSPMGQAAMPLLGMAGPMALPAISWLQQMMSGDTSRWQTLTKGASTEIQNLDRLIDTLLE